MNEAKAMEAANDGTVVLECRQLAKAFRQGSERLEVLREVDFQIRRGERLAIVGSSGSGKSTLLHLLGGLDTPTAGSVWVAGRELSRLGDANRGRLRNRWLGFVYQFHHLLSEFTALENVAMPLLIRGEASAEAARRAAELLERVGLGQRLRNRPRLASPNRLNSRPATHTEPAVGVSRPPNRCSSVLLPDPELPTMASRSPRRIRKSTSRNTSSRSLPCRNAFANWRHSNTTVPSFAASIVLASFITQRLRWLGPRRAPSGIQRRQRRQSERYQTDGRDIAPLNLRGQVADQIHVRGQKFDPE